MSEIERIPAGSIGRLVDDVIVGAPSEIKFRERRNREMEQGEVELQYQVPLKGTASQVLAFAPVTLAFPYELMYAPGQRDSTLPFPHFTYGSHTKPAVGVFASVLEWMLNEESGGMTGAVVAVAAIGKGKYEGWVHLSFQGYAVPLSIEEEDEE